ncbi:MULTISPECIES: DUF3788 family protein [Enterococcus]|uniref:Addiction module toxin RelE n=1 Tax=Candidatus Enterococcus mangumiae TaxID=2230878 RepID=A0ABZ2SYE6_9ENTE|nr:MULTISPECIES: DUF3788 family protein [unclassified Enterococcus]MBO0462147.1 DUF3788 family protein [Enterococcus sp. DIV1298c]MBO0490625.1 DUF3788 family protein [Enterococcus sp. DIV1094]MBO1300169.1 DUF3788 family protein [Enterococcus sp. DIV1271a]
MLNYENFDKETQPTEAEIKEFTDPELFSKLNEYLTEGYKIKPKYAYSNCRMDKNIWRGWNIKYRKHGKILCTIYPQAGYLLVLIPGRSFEVRDEKVLEEAKLAVIQRYEEISTK